MWAYIYARGSKRVKLLIVRWLSFKKSNFCDLLDKSLKLFLVIHMNISIQKNSGSKRDYCMGGFY